MTTEQINYGKKHVFDPDDRGVHLEKIIAFAVPLFLRNLFQQLYNTMDTIIVGKINGDEALAAVGVPLQ